MDHLPQPQNVAVHQPEVTAGVYYSQAALASNRLVLPTDASARRVEAHLPAEPTEQTSRAIGMAAIPQDSKGEQLNKLVYNGKTSEDYAREHNAWLANATAQQQRAQEAMLAAAKDDDESDDTGSSGRKQLVGAKR